METTNPFSNGNSQKILITVYSTFLPMFLGKQFRSYCSATAAPAVAVAATATAAVAATATAVATVAVAAVSHCYLENGGGGEVTYFTHVMEEYSKMF